MTGPQATILDDLLPGIQRSFFETVWPTFRWVKSLWIKEVNGQFHLFVETTTPQDDKEWSDFDYLAGRVFKATERLLDEMEPNSKHEVEHTIRHGATVPKDLGYRELMSDRIFKMLANRHAPWRLENGR